MANSIKAVPDGLRLRADGTVPVVNSRDVAEVFERPHKDVLGSIRGLEIGEDVRRSWFRSATVTDSYGREQPSYDLTRQGFVLLVMGWTGERAMTFKVAPT
jgi:Rha family phage regulatory protein